MVAESQNIEKEFNLNWGYWQIAHSVSDYTKQTFWQVLEDNVMAVLTVATLLKQQVTLEENRNGRLSS